jgi:hypothetical protein
VDLWVGRRMGIGCCFFTIQILGFDGMDGLQPAGTALWMGNVIWVGAFWVSIFFFSFLGLYLYRGVSELR